MSVHIGAERGEIAETVLLPGDPRRATFVAEEYLEGATLFNEVRGMLGYTGTWQGTRVSVMGTGMGMPSHSIYVHELIHEFGAKRLIRIGSCGAMQPEVQLHDLLLAMSACFDSSLNSLRFQGMGFAPSADFELLSAAHAAAAERGFAVRVGSILSSDEFYNEDPESYRLWAKYGVLAVEMESAALYTLAARAGVQALTILTVSDSLVRGEALSSAERERGFSRMAELALSLA